MCTYLTEKIAISGSAKGAAGWFRVTDGTVYFDHPVHASYGHTLNIDFLAPQQGPSVTRNQPAAPLALPLIAIFSVR